MASRQEEKTAPDLGAIGTELDLISYERLEEKYPMLAGTITGAIQQGATPGEIRSYALRHGMPKGWAAWLEQAARAVADD